MSFRISLASGFRTHDVWYENEYIRLRVGVVAKDRDKWELHHGAGISHLTEKGKAEMTELVKETITLLNITERLSP